MLNITVSVVSVVAALVKRFSEETLGRKNIDNTLINTKKKRDSDAPNHFYHILSSNKRKEFIFRHTVPWTHL